MSQQLTQLQELQLELHEVNLELVKVAEPLGRLSEMSLEERKLLGDEIRARLALWESVTQRISQVLGTASPTSP